MTSIKIINASQEIEKRASERYGDWNRLQHNEIVGFEIAKEEEYFDIIVSFNPIENKEYYLLYVQYTTGDSFGQSNGNIEHIGLYESRDLAVNNAKRIREHNETKSFKHFSDEYSVILVSEEGLEYRQSTSWKGYFERIESIVVMPITMGGSMLFF